MILDSKSRRDSFQTHNVSMFSFHCYEDFCPYLAHELKIMQLTDISYLLHYTTFSPWKAHAVKFIVFKVISKYVETKCQLDATDDFIADLIVCSTCFWHHYAHHQELESIIQVVAVCRIWCFVSGLRAARKPDTQPAAPHHTGNLKTKHKIRQAATTCILLSSS